jgi:ATP-dependent Clp protease ATP-binding subunit ClpC
MFERYTEKARRVIFFSRYEASHFGSPYIELEHLLLGLIREDKALLTHLLPDSLDVAEFDRQIRSLLTENTPTATSVDLPLSHDSKRVLAYGAEEAERLNSKHIGTIHLLLGLLRTDSSVAALLRSHGFEIDRIRERAVQSTAPDAGSVFDGLRRQFAALARGIPPEVEPATVFLPANPHREQSE